MIIKHIGAGKDFISGMENTDVESFNLLSKKTWEQIPDNSVDAYVAHHVLQEFQWRNLVALLREIHRTLKVGGVFRIGTPHLESGVGLDYLLSWGNINLFSKKLLSDVLLEVGFSRVVGANYQQTKSDIPILAKADNRQSESAYLEAIK